MFFILTRLIVTIIGLTLALIVGWFIGDYFGLAGIPLSLIFGALIGAGIAMVCNYLEDF